MWSSSSSFFEAREGLVVLEVEKEAEEVGGFEDFSQCVRTCGFEMTDR